MSAIDRLMRSMSLDLTKRSSRNSRIHLPESMLVALISRLNRGFRGFMKWTPPCPPNVCTKTERKNLPDFRNRQTFHWKKQKFNDRQRGVPWQTEPQPAIKACFKPHCRCC